MTQFFPLNNRTEQLNIKVLLAQEPLFSPLLSVIHVLYQHVLPRTLTLKRHMSVGVWKNKRSVYPDRSYVVESTLYRQGKIIVQIQWLVYVGKCYTFVAKHTLSRWKCSRGSEKQTCLWQAVKRAKHVVFWRSTEYFFVCLLSFLE